MKALASHLLSSENEEVRVLKLDGVSSSTIEDSLEEMRTLSLGTRTRKCLYHSSINVTPLESREMTDVRWLEAVEELGKELGMSGHQKAVVIHKKKGREHCHIVWNKVHPDTLKTASLSWNYKKHEEVSRRLEERWKLSPVIGVHSRPEGTDRPQAKATHSDWQASTRTGVTIEEISAVLYECWQSSDNGEAFFQACQQRSISLARGKRGMIAVDWAGTPHSIPRRLKIKAKEVQSKLSDLNPDDLPTVEAVQSVIKKNRSSSTINMEVTNMTDFDKDQIKGIRRKKPRNKKQSPEDILKDWVDQGYSGNISEDGSVWIDWGLNTRFHDIGDMITIHGPATDEAIQSMLDAGRAHGWESIEFFGDEDFKSRAYRLASLMEPPFPVSGYELPDHLKKELEIPDNTGPSPEPINGPDNNFNNSL